MLRPRTMDRDLALRHHCGNRKRAGDDAIRHGGVISRRKAADALDLDGRTARAINLRAHALQHAGKVDDLGLAGGVVDDSRASGKHPGHHQVLGGADTRKIEPDGRADQPVRCARDEKPVLAVELGAELLQPGDMEVEPARTDVVATRQRDARLTAAHEQRPEHRDRRSQPTHQVVVGLVPDLVGHVDHQVARSAVDRATQAPQQLRHHVDVENPRHGADRRAAWSQQRGGHQLQDAVLRAGDDHITGQSRAARDPYSFHRGMLARDGSRHTSSARSRVDA